MTVAKSESSKELLGDPYNDQEAGGEDEIKAFRVHKPERPRRCAWLPPARKALAAQAVVGFLLGASVVLTILAHEGHGYANLFFKPKPPPTYLLPWTRRVLPQEALVRGLGPLGTGARMARFASKLLSGQRVTVVVLGGSVSFGMGASSWGAAYPALFGNWLHKSFARSNVTLLNRSIPASSTSLSAICLERLVPEDADLVVMEFTMNDLNNQPLHTPLRYGPELLLRKLLRRPAAVVLLQYYSWYFAGGDWRSEGLFSYPTTEADFTTLAQYYDVPSLSFRAAVHPLIRQNEPGFQVDKTSKFDPARMPCYREMASPEEARDKLYGDCVHPSDTGHQAMADLLIGLVQRSLASTVLRPRDDPNLRRSPVQAAATAVLAAGAGKLGPAAARRTLGAALPPPLQSGVVDAPSSLCLMQEDFKSAVMRTNGFAYRPERPEAELFVGQKWGWTGTAVGAWAELLIDTRESKAGGGSQTPATVHLGYLRSWQHMGKAKIECLSGCKCKSSKIDGSWTDKVTLQQTHTFETSQHVKCRLRVTILRETASGEHKIQLSSVMVATVPIIDNATEDVKGALDAGR